MQLQPSLETLSRNLSLKLVSVKVEREQDIQDVTEEDLVSFSGQHQGDIKDLVSMPVQEMLIPTTFKFS